MCVCVNSNLHLISYPMQSQIKYMYQAIKAMQIIILAANLTPNKIAIIKYTQYIGE